MDEERRLSRDSRKVYYAPRESLQKSTRETLQVGSADECPTTMRPPPTGEDSSDTERSKGKLLASVRPETFLSSPRMTPRRFSNKDSAILLGYSGLVSEEEKLAPLGFEPEGSAASTPQCERWPTSLNDTLMDCQGFNSFYQYLKQEKSEILLDFWRACESFKRMAPISYEMRTAAKAIFQKFIYPGSSDALEINESTRSEVAQHVNDQPVDCNLFEDALSEIIAHMKNNLYPRYLNSGFYKECIKSGGESPKGLSERFTYTSRFHGGYLPTLPEEKVLGFDEIEEDGAQFEFEQHRKSVKGLSYCGKRSESDEHNARCLLHVPMKDLLSPYYYPTVPVSSRIESENQSLSSDALTEDALSVTTDSALTDDASSRCSSRRRCYRKKGPASHESHDSLPLVHFVPRTQRVPKEARQPTDPEEFARILIEKLEKVKMERELHEREAHNLAIYHEAPKKSILQEAIENKEKHDRIPLCTMAMSVVPEPGPYRAPHSDSNVVKSCASNTAAASVMQDPCIRHSQPQPQQTVRPKQPEVAESEPQPQTSVPPKDRNIWTAHPSRKDSDIPFLTLNHHRILQWIEEGEKCTQEETLRAAKSHPHRHHSPSTRSSSKSKQSSSSSTRQSEKSVSRHLPSQPIASDPCMPPLPHPHPSSVLEETKRRLIEVKESEKRSKHHQKQRSRTVADSDLSLSKGKASASSVCSATDFSSCGQSYLSHDMNHHPAPSVTSSSLFSSVSHAQSDPKSRDSGFSGSVKKKDKIDNTIIITYWLWGEPIPYRTSLPGKCVSLGQFKGLLPPRKGDYRFFFKRSTDDKDCEVVYEEVKEDSAILPTYDGKVVGKVERVDS